MTANDSKIINLLSIGETSFECYSLSDAVSISVLHAINQLNSVLTDLREYDCTRRTISSNC